MFRTTLTATALGLGALAIALAPTSSADPFLQRDFPCQEDEVLGYAPEFGPDRVGCIHIEQFTELWLDPHTGNLFYGPEDAGPDAERVLADDYLPD